MRVAQISLDGHLPRYGIGLAVVSLARALAARGHEVSLLVREARAPAVPPAAGVRVVPLRSSHGWFAARYATQVRRALAAGVDVLHVHGLSRMAWWLRGRRARRGAPLVLTAHAADELGPTASPAGSAPRRRAARHARRLRIVARRADALVAPSRWMAARLREEIGRGATVLGLGPSDETPSVRVAHAGFVVLVLARLCAVKGVDVVIDAVARMVDAGRDVHLVVAGDGPEHGALAARAQARGLGARVRFGGYVEGAARRALCAGADVVAVPTRGAYETFGLAALDGQAAGLPVVVADGGSLPERVACGGGLVARSGDVEAWTRALTQIADDVRLASDLAGQARRVATASSWTTVAQAHERLYEELLRPRRARGPQGDARPG